VLQDMKLHCWLVVADVSEERVDFIFKGQVFLQNTYIPTPGDEGNTFFRNVGNHSLNSVSRSRRPNPSVTPLW
jgi:hypothetical protein